MSFAAAAFLAGLAALAVPWWLHRRDRRDEQQRPVSSLLLMRPAETPERAKKALRHRWLLALRMLLLGVLVLAFAQPMVERAMAPQTAGANLPRIIAVDTSASMRAGFAAAVNRAHALIDDLPADGRAAVVAVAAQVTVVEPLTAERAALHAAVDAVRPGVDRLRFDGLAGRLTALAGSLTEGPVEIHLVSDFQSSAMPDQFNGLLAGAAAPVVLHPVTPGPENWLVEQVTVGDDVRVTVRGLHTSQRQLEVVLAGRHGELARRPVTVPANGRAQARFPLPEADSGDLWLRAAIGAGDRLSFDDTAYHVIRRADEVSLPLFAPPGSAAQLAYLTAAVSASAPRFRPAQPINAGPVAAVVDPGTLAGDRVRLLERHLDNGGAVLMTVGPATRQAGLLPLLDAAVEADRAGAEHRGVVAEDRSHPVLSGFHAWQEVTVARVLRTSEPTSGSVLLALDDGTPLLVEHRLGAGRVLVLMTSLDPAWSTLVLSPAFVGFVADALGYLAEESLPSAAVAGEPMAIPAANVQLFDADGNRLLSLGQTVERPAVPLEAPGIYTLRTPSRERLLAVNPDLRESDLAPANGELLERWQSASRSFETVPSEAATVVAADEGDRLLSLAPWLLLVLGLLAVLEPVMANTARGPVQRGTPS